MPANATTQKAKVSSHQPSELRPITSRSTARSRGRYATHAGAESAGAHQEGRPHQQGREERAREADPRVARSR